VARPLRIEVPGLLVHVTARGNERRPIVFDDVDRRAWLTLLRGARERYGWRVLAYCLMGNHYHLLVELTRAELARGLRQLNGVYAQRFNQRHRRWGICFRAATRPCWWSGMVICSRCCAMWC